MVEDFIGAAGIFRLRPDDLESIMTKWGKVDNQKNREWPLGYREQEFVIARMSTKPDGRP